MFDEFQKGVIHLGNKPIIRFCSVFLLKILFRGLFTSLIIVHFSKNFLDYGKSKAPTVGAL